MIELGNVEEKVVLVGVGSDLEEVEHSLEELEELTRTAGAKVVGYLTQPRSQSHATTYVGKGKLEELKDLIWEVEATGIVCDDELSPTQMKQLQEILEVKIMDRTLVILDIFAQRARTREGQIQVELAQLKYNQSKLIGRGNAMSRLGGGIGTRGPGEKKLEVDRRVIRHRIAQLHRELKEVRRHREIQRETRKKNHITEIGIVGYTNAGKSTLLNRLTGSEMLAEDKLFATLDPTTRRWILPSGKEVLLTDTVGFIRKLPHHLIEAFQGTLEEAKHADILFHVVDGSSPNLEEYVATVYETLDKLGVQGKTCFTLWNKSDLKVGDEVLRDFRSDVSLEISAQTGAGLEELAEKVEEVLREQAVWIEELFEYQDLGKIQSIRKYGEILEEAYQEEGVWIRGYLPVALWKSFQ